jgi:hypothetical protein
VCSYDGQQQQLAYGESHCGSASEDVIKGEDMKKQKTTKAIAYGKSTNVNNGRLICWSCRHF